MSQTLAIEEEAESSGSQPEQAPLRETRLPTPAAMRKRLSLSREAALTVRRGRDELASILHGEDTQRIVVIAGPCSIDDVDAALEYGRRLRALQDRISDRVLLVMRTYFEKPRSVVGWKGLLYAARDQRPQTAESGIVNARRLLGELNGLGIPCATEFLNPILALYLEDAIAYGSIGSRTAESQIHRELASRLQMPIGIKNAMDGDAHSAVNAVAAANQRHTLFGLDDHGAASLIETTGNPLAHVILRGGAAGPNYDSETVGTVAGALQGGPLVRQLIVDCSHGNSGKDHRRQAAVAREVIRQRVEGQTAIAGLMLESYLEEGRQDLGDLRRGRYGVSITDACIGWEETERLILEIAARSVQAFRL